MRENHNDKLDTLLHHRRFHPANPNLAERIMLKAQRVRRAKQRRLRSEKRSNLPQPNWERQRATNHEKDWNPIAGDISTPADSPSHFFHHSFFNQKRRNLL